MRRIITCMARVVFNMDNPVQPVMSRMGRIKSTFKDASGKIPPRPCEYLDDAK